MSKEEQGMGNEFIEQRIINAVRGLLTGRVNELLREAQFTIPLVEFGDYSGDNSVVPVITLASCERTEKERIIQLDIYSMTVSITFPEGAEGELYCYAYSGAFGRAIYDDPTLGGVTERTVSTTRLYIQPKKQHCGEGWRLQITLRIVVEGMGNERTGL